MLSLAVFFLFGGEGGGGTRGSVRVSLPLVKCGSELW